jgi:Spy/CpxP family protein refolding chaperone
MQGVKRMNGWKPWLGIVSVFIIGAVIGGLVTATLIRHHVIRVTRFGPPKFEEIVLNRMARNLDLTDEQRAAIRKIAAEYDPLFREIMTGSRDEVRRLQERFESQIKEILTPEQIVEFEKNIEHMHREPPEPRERRH